MKKLIPVVVVAIYLVLLVTKTQETLADTKAFIGALGAAGRAVVRAFRAIVP